MVDAIAAIGDCKAVSVDKLNLEVDYCAVNEGTRYKHLWDGNGCERESWMSEDWSSWSLTMRVVMS